MPPTAVPHRRPRHIMDYAALVNIASGIVPGQTQREHGRHTITLLLAEVARQMNCTGCILWRERDDPSQMGLMGAWFAALSDMPRLGRIQKEKDGKKTLAAQAIENVCGFAYSNDIVAAGIPYSTAEFMLQAGIRRTLACRVVLRGPGRATDRTFATPDKLWHGSLCVYRTQDIGEWTEKDISRLADAAQTVAELYRVIFDKSALSLLQETDRILQEASLSSMPISLEEVVVNYAEALERTFCAREVSIFIEDKSKPGRYRCAYTTEAMKERRQKLLNTVYQPGGDSYSELALKAEFCIRIRDMASPEQDMLEIQYRGVELDGLKKPKDFGQEKHHSLIATRLENQGRVVGLLRCLQPTNGPGHFLDEDAALLHRVARPLARFIVARSEEEMLSEDMQIFENMSGKKVPVTGHGYRDIFEIGLQLANELLPMARINTVRLEDQHCPGYLKIHQTAVDPKLIDVLAEEQLRANSERWRLDDGQSHASVVWCTHQTVLCDIVSDSNVNPNYRELFKNVRSLIVAPIWDGRNMIGTLDLRTLGEDRFPKHARDAAGFLGLLLGLAYSRTEERTNAARATLKALRAEAEQLRAQRALNDAFSDLSHQLKGPAANLSDAIGLLLRTTGTEPLQYELIKLSALARRVETYTKLIGFFGALAEGKNIDRASVPHTHADVSRHIKSLCAEFQARAGRGRAMSLQPDLDSIARHFPDEFLFDGDFLIQCLYNLLDNAVKYGDKGTAIEIKAGWPKGSGGQFYISVEGKNKAMPVTQDQIPLMTRRGWRHSNAARASGDGSGLGLHIVERIMNAAGGALRILPTRISKDWTTEFRLCFGPLTAKRHQPNKLLQR